MQQLKVTITTESPIVLTADSNATVMTETSESITGSVLRGVLATHFFRDFDGKEFKEEEFYRLFFKALRFTNANIAEVGSGEPSFVIPLSMQKEKAKVGKDEAVEDLIRIDTPTKGMKSFRGYAAIKGDNYLQTVSASKDVSLHMSRMSEGERKKGRSDDGGIYNYESIDAGQQFIGFVIGAEEDISTLREHLPIDSFECRIGRSKFTQYGKCRITLDDSTKPVKEFSEKELEPDGRKMILRFDSPYIFNSCTIDSDGKIKMVTAESAIEHISSIMSSATKENFRIERVFAAEDEIENYVGVWGMKRPRECALAAGTVFSLVKDSPWTEADFNTLTELAYRGVGRRTEEGFGQIRFWPKVNGKWAKGKDTEKSAVVSVPFDKVSDKVGKIVRKAFENRLVEQIRVYASMDAKEAKYTLKDSDFSGLTHFFSRLEHLLEMVYLGENNEDNKSVLPLGVREKYTKVLKSTVRAGSPMENHLRHVVFMINSQKLYDILMETSSTSKLPLLGHDCIENIGSNMDNTMEFMKIAGLKKEDFNLADGKYFYEYWHWFFRSMRKRAVAEKKGAKRNG